MGKGPGLPRVTTAIHTLDVIVQRTATCCPSESACSKLSDELSYFCASFEEEGLASGSYESVPSWFEDTPREVQGCRRDGGVALLKPRKQVKFCVVAGADPSGFHCCTWLLALEESDDLGILFVDVLLEIKIRPDAVCCDAAL